MQQQACIKPRVFDKNRKYQPPALLLDDRDIVTLVNSIFRLFLFFFTNPFPFNLIDTAIEAEKFAEKKFLKKVRCNLLGENVVKADYI